MYKLSVEIDKQLMIMSRFELTAEEWLFIQLLFLAYEDEPKEQYLTKYFNECAKTSIPRETILSLQDKKILLKSYKIPPEGKELDLSMLEFNSVFTKFYFKTTQEAGMELFTLFPPFLQYGDKLLPAKNVTTKGWNTLEDFFHYYGRIIGWKKDNHDEVMDMLQWAIDQSLIQYGMVEYVTTRKWIEHRAMRDSGEIGKFAIKVDTLQDS